MAAADFELPLTQLTDDSDVVVRPVTNRKRRLDDAGDGTGSEDERPTKMAKAEEENEEDAVPMDLSEDKAPEEKVLEEKTTEINPTLRNNKYLRDPANFVPKYTSVDDFNTTRSERFRTGSTRYFEHIKPEDLSLRVEGGAERTYVTIMCGGAELQIIPPAHAIGKYPCMGLEGDTRSANFTGDPAKVAHFSYRVEIGTPELQRFLDTMEKIASWFQEQVWNHPKTGPKIREKQAAKYKKQYKDELKKAVEAVDSCREELKAAKVAALGHLKTEEGRDEFIYELWKSTWNPLQNNGHMKFKRRFMKMMPAKTEHSPYYTDARFPEIKTGEDSEPASGTTKSVKRFNYPEVYLAMEHPDGAGFVEFEPETAADVLNVEGTIVSTALTLSPYLGVADKNGIKFMFGAVSVLFMPTSRDPNVYV